jgi:hypothetical protein
MLYAIKTGYGHANGRNSMPLRSILYFDFLRPSSSLLPSFVSSPDTNFAYVLYAPGLNVNWLTHNKPRKAQCVTVETASRFSTWRFQKLLPVIYRLSISCESSRWKICQLFPLSFLQSTPVFESSPFLTAKMAWRIYKAKKLAKYFFPHFQSRTIRRESLFKATQTYTHAHTRSETEVSTTLMRYTQWFLENLP